jgi:acyl-coenzyme A thioesterase PaaI-like protein
VTHIADDFTSASVEMPQRWYNTNYLGTHFGGSLYAMIDPFYVLLVMNRLGREYIVWDKSAQIDFLKPGRGTVAAHFDLSDSTLEDIRSHTEDGDKYLPQFTVDIKDEEGIVVARAVKTLYVRKKKQ